MSNVKKEETDVFRNLKVDEPGLKTIIVHNNSKKESFLRKVIWNLGSAGLVAFLMNFMGLRTIIVCACWGLLAIFGHEVPETVKQQFQKIFHAGTDAAQKAVEKSRQEMEAAKAKIDEALKKTAAARAEAKREIDELKGRLERVKKNAESVRNLSNIAGSVMSYGEEAKRSIMSLVNQLGNSNVPWRSLFGSPRDKSKQRLAARARTERQQLIDKRKEDRENAYQANLAARAQVESYLARGEVAAMMESEREQMMLNGFASQAMNNSPPPGRVNGGVPIIVGPYHSIKAR